MFTLYRRGLLYGNTQERLWQREAALRRSRKWSVTSLMCVNDLCCPVQLLFILHQIALYKLQKTLREKRSVDRLQCIGLVV